MASDLNRVMIIGRIVRDPELRYTPNGTAVANFSVANNRSYVQGTEKKEQASFFNCIAWGKLGELVVQYCKKGARLGLEGRLQQRSWEDQNGNKRSAVEIVAENVQFLSPRDNAAGGDVQIDMPAQDQAPQSAPAPVDNNPFSDDDIPF